MRGRDDLDLNGLGLTARCRYGCQGQVDSAQAGPMRNAYKEDTLKGGDVPWESHASRKDTNPQKFSKVTTQAQIQIQFKNVISKL